MFPEIDADRVTFSQGMDITICTSTNNDDEARELLRLRHVTECRSREGAPTTQTGDENVN